ncbi:MAG: S-formylglutathione hydrolase FrmB [Patescibacteria group bacterium]|nr:S-formylglutathione hydrolase FrmB [Patescibacteria group bacterium]
MKRKHPSAKRLPLQTLRDQVPRRLVALVIVLACVVVGAVSIYKYQADAATAAFKNPARVVSEHWANSRTLELTIKSPSIGAPNRLVRLLLPPKWSKTSLKKWPTLWLLHGGYSSSSDWLAKTNIASLSAGHNAIVVIPDTSWCSAYSDWWNNGKHGAPAWDSYLTSEVRQILETGYRANATRAVIGYSMGGLGALKLPANHPGMFVAAASFSGDIDPLHSYDRTADGPDLPGLSCGADWKSVWGDYNIPAQKAIWQHNDPYDQAAQLGKLNYLYIASGDGLADPLRAGGFMPDPAEKQVNVENRALVSRLKTLGVPVTSHFYPGNHTWPYWKRELNTVFPAMLKALKTN